MGTNVSDWVTFHKILILFRVSFLAYMLIYEDVLRDAELESSVYQTKKNPWLLGY